MGYILYGKITDCGYISVNKVLIIGYINVYTSDLGPGGKVKRGVRNDAEC